MQPPRPPISPWITALNAVAFPANFLSVGFVFGSDGSVSVSVNASYTRGLPLTLFDVSGLSATILPAVSGNVSSFADVILFSNQRPYASAQNCSISAFLVSTDPQFASWPANTRASLQFSVDATGAVQVPTIGGVALQQTQSDGAQSCQPAHFSSAPLLGSDFFSII